MLNAIGIFRFNIRKTVFFHGKFFARASHSHIESIKKSVS